MGSKFYHLTSLAPRMRAESVSYCVFHRKTLYWCTRRHIPVPGSVACVIVRDMPLEDTEIIPDNATPAKIIAAGIVIAFCYWASSVLVTVLVAVLLAYFLDPVVTFMENWHIPRALGRCSLFSLPLPSCCS